MIHASRRRSKGLPPGLPSQEPRDPDRELRERRRAELLRGRLTVAAGLLLSVGSIVLLFALLVTEFEARLPGGFHISSDTAGPLVGAAIWGLMLASDGVNRIDSAPEGGSRAP